MHRITLTIILLLAATCADAAWYQKTDGTIVDPIQFWMGGDLEYAGNNLESGADLSGANLSGAVLTNADLESVDLENAGLSDSILTDADLNNASMSGAFLLSANLTGASLRSVSTCMMAGDPPTGCTSRWLPS